MSGFNLPDGCSPGDPHAPWNEEPERCCGTCAWWTPLKDGHHIGRCDWRWWGGQRDDAVGYWHQCARWDEA